MKHFILLTSVGLCSFAFGCGGTENAASADGAGAGPQWFPSVEVGEAGASATDPGDSEENVAESTSEALTLKGTWQLQLPNGDTSASVNTDHKPWYTTAADGGRLFMDPTYGHTSSGSKHPRTELREGEHWLASGNNKLTVTGKVLNSSSITVGQIFNEDDKITLAELQYTSSGFQVFYEEEKSHGFPMAPLNVSVPVGTKYTFTMSLTKGKVTVTVNGHTYTHTPSSKVSGNHFYFKVGNYDQKATKNDSSVSNTVSSIVENYSVSISH